MKNINWVVTIIWGVQYKISTTNQKKNGNNLKNKIPISKPIHPQYPNQITFNAQ